jgi:hypothetical protein
MYKQTLKKLRTEEMFLNMIKAIYDKPIAHIIVNRGELKPFPLTSATKKDVHFPHSYSVWFWNS